jgi:hypothetical protein
MQDYFAIILVKQALINCVSQYRFFFGNKKGIFLMDLKHKYNNVFLDINDIVRINKFINAYQIRNAVKTGKLKCAFKTDKGKFVFSVNEVEKYIETLLAPQEESPEESKKKKRHDTLINKIQFLHNKRISA